MRHGQFRIPITIAVLLLAGFGYRQYAVFAGERTISARLQAAHIDLVCEDSAPDDVVTILRQKLVEADDWFAGCDIQADFASSQSRLFMDLHNTPAIECLNYVSEVSQSQYRLRPKTIIIAPLGSDYRDSLEKATDAAVARAKKTWSWVRTQVGLETPLPPMDPFAP